MAGIFHWLGFGVPNPQATDHGDGGAASRMDRLIDDDGPLARAPRAETKVDRSRMSFEVTEATRLGGSGLFHGKE
jgi:hypothetical protein